MLPLEMSLGYSGRQQDGCRPRADRRGRHGHGDATGKPCNHDSFETRANNAKEYVLSIFLRESIGAIFIEVVRSPSNSRLVDYKTSTVAITSNNSK